MESSLVEVSDALLAARRDCTPLSAFPGVLPTTLDDAYAVQARSTGLWGDELVGYKVGGIPPAHRPDYEGTWLAGPIFAGQTQSVDDGGRVEVTVYEGGFAAYEAEIVFAITSLPTDAVTAATAMDHVAEVRIGAEIASSPLGDINDIGPGAIISDFGNNAGLVVGPRVDPARLDELFATTVRVEIDGEEIGAAAPKPGEEGPLGALAFLLDRLRTQGASLPEGGLMVSSGAITGVHRSEAGSTGRVDFGAFGTFDLAMVARGPQG